MTNHKTLSLLSKYLFIKSTRLNHYNLLCKRLFVKSRSSVYCEDIWRCFSFCNNWFKPKFSSIFKTFENTLIRLFVGLVFKTSPTNNAEFWAPLKLQCLNVVRVVPLSWKLSLEILAVSWEILSREIRISGKVCILV